MEKNKLEQGRKEQGYHKGLDKPAIVFGKYELFIDPEFTEGGNKPTVATWAGENAAKIDEKAFDILERHCDGDKAKLEEYLKAITEFEINYSDNEERHKNRLPIENEILDIMKKGGYFD